MIFIELPLQVFWWDISNLNLRLSIPVPLHSCVALDSSHRSHIKWD